MNGELHWLYIDRLASHYGAASAHVDRIDSLATELSQVANTLQHRAVSMTDLSTFLSPRVESATEITRQIAWMSQHVFGARAWAVGQKIIESPRGMKPHCPYTKQLEVLGVDTSRVDFARHKENWKEYTPQNKIDCMLYDPKTSTVYLVKGQSSSAAKRFGNLRLTRREDRSILFGQDDAVMAAVWAQADAFASLLLAHELISTACRHINVRAFFVTTEDPGCSGRFQYQEVSSDSRRLLGGQRVCLDELPVVATHEHWEKNGEFNPDSMLSVPSTGESDYLWRAPVDLPIRSLMILRTLFEQQEQCAARLYLRSQREIAEMVSGRFKLHYPKNMARHDLDRLQRVGLLDWAPNGSATQGLTAAGVARVEILTHRFNLLVPRSSTRLLEAIEAQEALWSNASLV